MGWIYSFDNVVSIKHEAFKQEFIQEMVWDSS